MLQQTQVDRVVEKYRSFTRRFRNFKQLSRAPFSAVLQEWQGLGYNRRAMYVHNSAKKVVREYGGRLPRDPEIITTFPGIGAATAASICAFAFNMPTVFIETNIRSVFIHHFFNDRTDVHDDELLPLVSATCDRRNAYKWYSALMDYGVSLKKLHKNPSRKSTHHVRQAPFIGSNRQIRGAVLRMLNTYSTVTLADIVRTLHKDRDRVQSVMSDLEKEGFVRQKNKRFSIAG
jgi:A/G-specific adenine glycosylase